MKSSSSQGAGGSEKMWRNNGALHIIQDDMGASQTCDGDVTFILPRAPFLAVIFTHFQPPCPVCSSLLIAALILWQICGEFNGWKTQGNDGFGAEKRGKERSLACRRLQGAINVNWKWVKRPAVRTQKSLIPQNNKSTPITPCGPGAVVPCGFCGEKRHQWLYTSRKVNPVKPEGKAPCILKHLQPKPP